MNKIVIIAQQIAQGMGYLHHRGIIHKDLKTKNIFLENGRAIITDFGLVNVARRLCANTRFGQEAVSFSALTERYVFMVFFCDLFPEGVVKYKSIFMFLLTSGHIDLQFWKMSIDHLSNKPYVNDVTMREQNLS